MRGQVRVLGQQALEAYLATLPVRHCLDTLLARAAQEWDDPCSESAVLHVRPPVCQYHTSYRALMNAAREDTCRT